MTVIEALILGIIQGLTEFLPISSSGHIELGNAVMDLDSNLLFTIMVHGATALSTIIVFRKEIWILLKDVIEFKYNESTSYIFSLLISMLPIAIVGFLFEEQIETFFSGKLILVGFMLLITSGLLGLTYYAKNKDGEVTYLKALMIGLAQTIAILPGISRSGATISTALLLGIEREKAARFSFLMVLIPILGGTLLKVIEFIKNPEIAGNISAAALAVGFLGAFISGLVACQWMLAIVKKGKLIYFAIYCLILGLVAIISSQ
ncbi:MAG: undecaprenyl-diphosphate phosphatase [Cyclobacteriaceae bacterium]